MNTVSLLSALLCCFFVSCSTVRTNSKVKTRNSIEKILRGQDIIFSDTTTVKAAFLLVDHENNVLPFKEFRLHHKNYRTNALGYVEVILPKEAEYYFRIEVPVNGYVIRGLTKENITNTNRTHRIFGLHRFIEMTHNKMNYFLVRYSEDSLSDN
jgi:hypothetical protein